MKITLIAVGKKIPNWVNSGYAEYFRRISGECELQLLEIAAVKRGNASHAGVIKAKEASLIQRKIPKGNHVIALDETGIACTNNSPVRKTLRLAGWRS